MAAFGTPAQVIAPQPLEQVYGIEMDVACVTDRYGRTHTICLPVRRPDPQGGLP